MGYQTYVTGELRIEPRLSSKACDELGLGEDGGSDLIATSGGEDDTVEYINGQITVVPGRSWTRLESRWEEPFKAYTIGDTIEAVAAFCAKSGATVEGAIYLDGEESSDFSRYRIENGKVVHEQAEWVWPNGDKGRG